MNAEAAGLTPPFSIIWLNLDSRGFAKIFIYIFVPAIFFTKIYYASVTLKEVWFILEYVMAIQLLMLVIAFLWRAYRLHFQILKGFEICPPLMLSLVVHLTTLTINTIVFTVRSYEIRMG